MKIWTLTILNICPLDPKGFEHFSPPPPPPPHTHTHTHPPPPHPPHHPLPPHPPHHPLPPHPPPPPTPHTHTYTPHPAKKRSLWPPHTHTPTPHPANKDPYGVTLQEPRQHEQTMVCECHAIVIHLIKSNQNIHFEVNETCWKKFTKYLY